MSVPVVSLLRGRQLRCSIFLLLTLLTVLTTTVNAAPAIPVFVQEVRQESFIQTLEALGTLRANESVTLSASVTETVSALHFDDGQRVEAGYLLAELTNAEEKAQLSEAQSALEEAERQYRRVQSLAESRVSTESVLDERYRAYRIAQAQLQAVESRLQDLLIKAPFAGVVGLRNISVGTLVRPGDTITTLDDDSEMKLDMAVPSVYLDVLRPGLGVEASARGMSGKTFTGEIASISSRIDPVTRSVVVRAIIPNEEQLLKPGLLMTVKLQKPPRDAVVVAEEAVVQQGNRARVYVIDETTSPTTVMERTVVLGARQPGRVEAVDGLMAGERVVIHGTMKLRNGSEVRVAATATADDTLQDLLKKAEQPAAVESAPNQNQNR